MSRESKSLGSPEGTSVSPGRGGGQGGAPVLALSHSLDSHESPISWSLGGRRVMAEVEST